MIVHPRVYTSIRVNYCDFVSGSVVIVVVVVVVSGSVVISVVVVP